MSEGNHSPGSSGSSPESLDTDHGPEFTAHAIGNWLECLDVKTLSIEPGRPWESGYHERFNSTLRDEGLPGEIFDTLQAVQVLIERWPQTYHRNPPHRPPGYRPPAPEGIW